MFSHWKLSASETCWLREELWHRCQNLRNNRLLISEAVASTSATDRAQPFAGLSLIQYRDLRFYHPDNYTSFL